MVRLLLISIFSLLLVNALHAQDALTGRIYENKKRSAIPGIVVQNLSTHRTVVSDRTGGFSIPAKVGDLVVFTGFSYQPDTLYVKDLKYIEILLDLKQNMLKEVKVTETETHVGSLKAKPTLSPINSQTVVYHQNDTGGYDGGLTVRLFDSHKDEKKRQKIAQLEKEDNIRAQIKDIFNVDTLQNYVPLKGQEMENFIRLYTPEPKTFTDKSFNLTVYLNSCYKEFMQMPVDKRQSKYTIDLKKPF